MLAKAGIQGPMLRMVPWTPACAGVTIPQCDVAATFANLRNEVLERRWGDFEAPSRVPDLWLVLNDDFRPAASHIRSSPGEADRLSARIGPQAQREQVGETEGSLDVLPVVGLESHADRECCRRKAF